VQLKASLCLNPNKCGVVENLDVDRGGTSCETKTVEGGGEMWKAIALAVIVTLPACASPPEDRCEQRGMTPGQPGYHSCVMYFSGFVEPDLDGGKCQAAGMDRRKSTSATA
jgi:hypothetical protein